MSKRGRVVWNEGLLLTPQHFQLLDRYHEEWAADLMQSSRSFGWGFTRLKLGEEALQNGKLQVQEAAGVLRGGVPFAVPEVEVAPPIRDVLAHFPVDRERIRVFLGLRTWRPEEPQFDAAANGSETIHRYRLDELDFPDETTGRDKRRLQLCRSNLKLLFPDEDLNAYDHLPIAEIERRDGKLVFRERYIPPCLGIGASRALQRVLAKVHELLVTRARDLRDRRGAGGGITGFAVEDVLSFWTLGVVSGFIPPLAHCLRAGGTHPEVAYLLLSQLAGQLTTLKEERAIPAYSHDDPEATFLGLEEDIQELLVGGIPRQHRFIELVRRDAWISEARFTNEHDLDPRTALYLGVFASEDADLLPRKVSDRVKLGSPDRIMDEIVAPNLPGVELRHVPNMPVTYKGKAGYVYFLIQKAKSGEWPFVAGASALSVYVPGDIRESKLELVALRDPIS